METLNTTILKWCNKMKFSQFTSLRVVKGVSMNLFSHILMPESCKDLGISEGVMKRRDTAFIFFNGCTDIIPLLKR